MSARGWSLPSCLSLLFVTIISVRRCRGCSGLFKAVAAGRGRLWLSRLFVAVVAVRGCRGCSWLSSLFVAVPCCPLLFLAVPGCRGVASRGNLWLFVAVVVDRWCSWLYVAVCVCSWLAWRTKSWRAMLRSTWPGVTEKASQRWPASQPASRPASQPAGQPAGQPACQPTSLPACQPASLPDCSLPACQPAVTA